MKDLYSVLGLDKDANPSDIKKAFRKLAKDMHPDRGGNVEAYQTLSFAYTILSDEAKRALYDQTGSTSLDSLTNLLGQFKEHLINPQMGASFLVNGYKFLDQQITSLVEQERNIENCIKQGKERLKKLQKSNNEFKMILPICEQYLAIQEQDLDGTIKTLELAQSIMEEYKLAIEVLGLATQQPPQRQQHITFNFGTGSTF